MKKVLLAILLVALAFATLACGDLTVADQKPVVTTEPPKTSAVPTTTTEPPVVTQPIVKDDTKYHLNGLKEENVALGDFVFDVYENGAALVGYTGNGGEVVVPNKVNDKEVSLVDDRAFAYSRTITKITLPESVVRIGKEAFYYCRDLVSVEIPAAVKAIGSESFAFCTSIKAVEIPSTVTEIGAKMFYNCVSLESAVLPIKDIPSEMFAHCSSLKKYDIASDAEKIGDYAFYYCTAMEKIDFPAGLKEIGKYAFANCSSIKDIDIPTGITELSAYVFYGCSGISDIDLSNITVYGDFSLYGCTSLEEIKISKDTEKLGAGSFANCVLLEEIVIPDTIKEIPVLLFGGCEKLTSIKFADDISAIGTRAFMGTGIKSIHISSSVKTIGTNVFEGCKSLKNVTFDNQYDELYVNVNSDDLAKIDQLLVDTDATIGTGENEKRVSSVIELIGKRVEKDAEGKEYTVITYRIKNTERREYQSLCKAIDKVITEAEMSTVKASSFLNCFTTLGVSVFEDCTALESIVLSDNITSIGNNAFYGCESLSAISFGAGLQRIGKSSFHNCPNLKSVYIPNTIVDIGKEGLGFVDQISVNETTGKEVITSVPTEGFVIQGFTGGIGHMYANTSKIPFESVGLVGCVPFADLIYVEVKNGETTTYKITGYKGNDSIVGLPSNRDGVFFTEIADGAFENMTFITELSIPESYKKIGDFAFAGCTGITKISLFDTEEKVEIGKGAFKGLAIKTITLPKGLEVISDSLFEGCTALKTVTLPAACKSIGKLAFAGTKITTLAIPDTVESIGEGALLNASVESLTLPFIGENADSAKALTYLFGAPCETLKTLTVTDIATAIADSACKDFTALETVTIGSGVKTLGNYVFAGCTSLKGTIEFKFAPPAIPNGVDHLLDGVPSAVYVKASKDYELTDNGDGFKLWNGVKLASSPSVKLFTGEVNGLTVELTYAGVLNIKGDAKIDNYTLENLPVWARYPGIVKTIKLSGVTEIGDYAFYGFENVESITIVESVTRIGNKAFAECAALKTVTLPEGATIDIAENAFENTPYQTAKDSAAEETPAE